jgi:hypothetical protein
VVRSMEGGRERAVGERREWCGFVGEARGEREIPVSASASASSPALVVCLLHMKSASALSPALFLYWRAKSCPRQRAKGRTLLFECPTKFLVTELKISLIKSMVHRRDAHFQVPRVFWRVACAE